MKDLSTITAEHAQQLEAENPFVWLYEMQTKEDPPRRYRVTNALSTVLFGENSDGDRLAYEPVPVVHGQVEENSEGSLPSISITFANTGPIFARSFDDADGFVGQPFSITLVSTLELGNPGAAVTESGEVISASISSESVTIQVSAFNLYRQEFPPFIHTRLSCRHRFGSAACGYLITAPGAGFTECPKTFPACEARGDDEVARGLPRLHPRRFGGFPGIPRPLA